VVLDLKLIRNIRGDAADDAQLAQYYTQFLADKRDQVAGYDTLFHIVDHPTIKAIRNSGRIIWMIAHNDVTIGFITFAGGFLDCQNCIGIYDFFIDKPHRQQGLGRKTLNIILASLFTMYPKAERVGLAVFSGNRIAKSLYASVGFSNTLDVMVLEKPKF
jgi:GNAT superfamily N-acetyltransferase